MNYRHPSPVTVLQIVAVAAAYILVAWQESNSDKYAVEATSFAGIGTLLVLFLDGCVAVTDIIALDFGVPCQVTKDRFDLAEGFRFVVAGGIVVEVGMYAEASRRYLDHRQRVDRILLE